MHSNPDVGAGTRRRLFLLAGNILPAPARWTMSRAGHNLNGRRRAALRRARHGGTTGGLLLTLSLLGALAAVAVVTPAYLLASGPAAPEPVAARVPAHQEMIELLGSLISRSREVLAVHERGSSPYLEIVLWLEDAENQGRIDPDEIAVITHSEVMRTISYFGLPEDGEAGGREDAESPPARSTFFEGGSDIRVPSFCATWRSRPDVQQRVLGVGVALMDVQRLPTARDGRTMLRISLTWASDLADGSDEASVLVDVLMRPDQEA
jgi:hypothetical protein